MDVWTQSEPNTIDLSGLPRLPDRLELYAQGEDQDGAFECRQARHDLCSTTLLTPVRNAKGEIDSQVSKTTWFVGCDLDEEAKTATMPARPGWPASPFSMVKVVAVMEDAGAVVDTVVLADKVPVSG